MNFTYDERMQMNRETYFAFLHALRPDLSDEQGEEEWQKHCEWVRGQLAEREGEHAGC
jgi:hypothetical protein